MATDNVEVVREAAEALAEGGLDALLPLIDDDFEVTTPASLAAEPDTYRGPEGVRRWFDSFYEVMDEVRIEPRGEYEAVGEDRVLAPFTLTARGQATQLEFSQEAVMVWTVRDGRIARTDVFPTIEEAHEAVSRL